MLTRIELDGFKTFEEFGLDLSPFAVVLGGNASGKSNLFDAIQFLAHLASSDLRSASRGLRGDADELFRRTAPGVRQETMTFAAEVLLDPTVRDPWGREVALTHTRIRYELTIRRVNGNHDAGRLIVSRERALPIMRKDDRWLPFGRHVSREFREAHLRYSRRAPFLDTEMDGAQLGFKIHQDGTAGRTRPGQAAEATVLSSITTADFPHLFALREELRSWRLLQLDPVGLRRPAPIHSDDALLADGSNLAAVLFRIKNETRDDSHPKGVLADIAAELTGIIPGVLDVDATLDDAAREYRARVRLRDGLEFPSAVISDGTLRVLALVTLLHDPHQHGVVCFEEPENGVHPARLRTLMQRLRDLVSDPVSDQDGVAEPLRQLLMNSHSPVVLSALKTSAEPAQLLFADVVAVTDPHSKAVRRKTRVRPVTPEDQGQMIATSGAVVSRFEVDEYLRTVDGEV